MRSQRPPIPKIIVFPPKPKTTKNEYNQKQQHKRSKHRAKRPTAQKNMRSRKQRLGHECHYFVNSTDFWSNVLPFLDAQALKTCTRLNHKIQTLVLSQEVVPYYATSLQILITHIPHDSNVTQLSNVCRENLFRLNEQARLQRNIATNVFNDRDCSFTIEKLVTVDDDDNGNDLFAAITPATEATDEETTTTNTNKQKNDQQERKQQRRLIMNLHFQPCQGNTVQWNNGYYMNRSLDAFIIISERSYVNLRSLKKKLGIDHVQNLPIVFINKELSSPPSSSSSVDGTDAFSSTSFDESSSGVKTIRFTNPLPLNEKTVDTKTAKTTTGKSAENHQTALLLQRQVENQTAQFLLRSCEMSRRVHQDIAPHYFHNISALLNMSQPSFFHLVESLSQMYHWTHLTMPLNPWNSYLRAICFSQFDTHIQRRLLEKFFRHYVGYKHHMHHVIRMTEDARDEIQKLGLEQFEQWNDMIWRLTNRSYGPVSITFEGGLNGGGGGGTGGARSNFVVRYWQVQCHVTEMACHRIALSIPTSVPMDDTHDIRISTEVTTSKPVHNVGQRLMNSLQDCVDYWVTLMKDDD